ncbi:MAG: hypothetical protein K0S26_2531 [Bacteroidota bacterium]|jgi:putative SOS response-associated peptidase YedK|nr:hypothetical protein [Bacteroidota bacterium]
MCYTVSAVIKEEELRSLEHEYVIQWQESDPPVEFYSVSGFSHPNLPVITSEGEFKNLRWGLIPSWVKDWENASKLRTQTLNAIGDTIDSKPSFRGAVKANHTCIIPLNGFYEWHHHANADKFPHFIYPKNDALFYVAGLHEVWKNPAIGDAYHTFTIITTAANERMEWIHNSKKRMPAILNLRDSKIWLDKEVSPKDKLSLLTPFDVNEMTDHPVSKLITSRKESPNQPKVRERFDYTELMGA